MAKDQETINKHWELWKEVLLKDDGSVNVEQLKFELSDYVDLIDRMSVLTSRLTGGKLSYPNYTVETILEAHEEYLESERNRIYVDFKKQIEHQFSSKDIFLFNKNETEIMGLHSVGDYDENGNWYSIDSWINVYDKDKKFKYSASRFSIPFEEELEAWKKLEWEEIK